MAYDMGLTQNATANMLIDKIAALTDEIADGKETYKQQKAQTSTYKKRLKQLKNIRSNVKGKFDDNVSSIKSKQNSLGDKLADATSGLVYERTLTSSISSDREQAVENDTYMSAVLANIEAEINTCNGKVESAAEQASATKSATNEKVDVTKGYIAQLKQLVANSESPINVPLRYLAAPSKIR